jgi:exopolysaccharide biosynthesis polyprenyl glycosylphosphotransferase
VIIAGYAVHGLHREMGAWLSVTTPVGDLGERYREWAKKPRENERPARSSVGWRNRYTRAVVISDLTVVVLAALGGTLARLGEHSHLFGDETSVPLATASAVLVVSALAAVRCWDERILGQGSEEFSRLIRAFAGAAIALGLLGLALQVQAARPWVFGVIPVTGAVAMAARYGLRRLLHKARGKGACLLPVLAVGTESSIANLVQRTNRAPHHGWVVTGACTSRGIGAGGAGDAGGVPVVGDLDAVASLARSGAYSVVAVAPTPGWTSSRLHELSWSIEGTGVELVVDPGLMEVAGPRLHIAPVDGLPLLRLSEPRFTGMPRVAKVVFDKVLAGALVVVLSPLLLAIAVAVRMDGGPVFFRQTRVGLGHQTFSMIKFRSMVVDAEQKRQELLSQNEGSGPLFKMRKDPRVTRVGEFIRRYSLDELPQLFNVLNGTMSLVGPRPPLPSEVDAFAEAARRKLLVRPGMTGLWQVSGRSELSWEETVRLDLRYVENWTPAMDLAILWKTVGAVVQGSGAY